MNAKQKSLAMVVAIAMLLMAPAAYAGGAQATSGEFQTFADGAGLGYSVEGKAHMVRTVSGKTIVTVNVSSLTPGATYGSHVHLQACADGNAGGHYRFDQPVVGGDLDGYEIWPGPFTANASGNASGKATVQAIAGASARSVVIHAPTGQKIACADLS